MNQANIENLRPNLAIPPFLPQLNLAPSHAQQTFLASNFVQPIVIPHSSQLHNLQLEYSLLRSRINFIKNFLETQTQPEDKQQPAINFGASSIENVHQTKGENLKLNNLECENSEPKFTVKEEEPCETGNQSNPNLLHTPPTKGMTQTELEDEKLDTEPNSSSRKKRIFWLPEEDEKLLELMEIHGQRWTRIASFLPDRNGKQVRDRYLNYLRPAIKQAEWSEKEEELLEKLFIKFGNKWSKIAERLPGRTENQVKNKFHAKTRMVKCIPRKRIETAPNELLKLVKKDPNFENTLNVQRVISRKLKTIPLFKEGKCEIDDNVLQSIHAQVKGVEQTPEIQFYPKITATEYCETIKRPETPPNELLKLVKMDPNFEKSLNVQRKISQKLKTIPLFKKGKHEIDESLLQSIHNQVKSAKPINQSGSDEQGQEHSKPITPSIEIFNQTGHLAISPKPSGVDPQEKDLGAPYKKVKPEITEEKPEYTDNLNVKEEAS